MNVTEASTSECYFNNGIYSDVCLNVIRGIQKRQFHCHKIILSSKSEELEKLVEDKNDVRVRDVDPDIFNILLYFVYTNKIKTVPIDSMSNLFESAHELGINSFKSEYKKEIKFNLKSYALYDLEYSRKTGDTAREKICQSFIEKYAKEVLKTNIIDSVGQETILWLLDHEKLNLETDFELLEFLAKYRNITFPSEAFMHTAKKKIRYLNMDKLKLVLFNREAKILDDCEIFMVRMNLDRVDSKWSMPAGFTKNRTQRLEQYHE